MDVVAQGELTTDTTRDYTAKVDVTGLAADTTYFYRFLALGHASPVGRTKPGADHGFRLCEERVFGLQFLEVYVGG